MQNIRPYLDAVPVGLRTLILYAQGRSLVRDGADVDLLPYAQYTIRWKSKVEAGSALAAMGHRAEGVKAMLDGVKEVQACGIPRIVLEALMETGCRLGPLDPGRARFLLDCAVKLAESHHRSKDVEQAKRLIAGLLVIPPQGPSIPRALASV